MKTVLAVDGNSLTHRAYHAFLGRDGAAGRTNSKGEAVWAVEGLLGFIAVLLERTGASKLVVGFDDASYSKRKITMPDYKAGRSEKDADLVSQLKLAPQVLRELGVEVLTPQGLEADDVLFGVSSWAKENGMRCIIATSDRDSFALIDENTSVLRLVNGGADRAEMFNPDELFGRYGVKAGGYSLYAAIRGDASDNLPGVTGIGEKGAAQIVAITPTYADLMKSLDSETPLNGGVTKGMLKKLEDAQSLARLKLNNEMMQMISVEIPAANIVDLPLKTEPFALLSERDGFKFSARTLKGFTQSSASVTKVGAQPDFVPRTEVEEVFDYKENPSKSEISARLQKTWQGLGGSASGAQKTDALRPSIVPKPRLHKEESLEATPKAFQMPNPRPQRSLLSQSLR